MTNSEDFSDIMGKAIEKNPHFESHYVVRKNFNVVSYKVGYVPIRSGVDFYYCHVIPAPEVEGKSLVLVPYPEGVVFARVDTKKLDLWEKEKGNLEKEM